eukprot:scaffold17458_cov140-Isochrysis_galbana.AAC.2
MPQPRVGPHDRQAHDTSSEFFIQSRSRHTGALAPHRINVLLFGEEELPLSFGALLHKVRGGLYAGDLVEFFDRLCVEDVAVDGIDAGWRGHGRKRTWTSTRCACILYTMIYEKACEPMHSRSHL